MLSASGLEGIIVFVDVYHGLHNAVLEVDLDLVVVVDISQHFVTDRVGSKLVVIGDKANTHMAVVGIFLHFQSQSQEPGAIFLMPLLKNNMTGLFVDESVTR